MNIRYSLYVRHQKPFGQFYSRGQEILEQRAIIKSNTMATRRKCTTIDKSIYKRDRLSCLLNQVINCPKGFDDVQL